MLKSVFQFISALPFLSEGIIPKWTIKLKKSEKGEDKENILNEKEIFKKI